MSIKLQRFMQGYIALITRNGLTIAATIKPRQSRDAAVLDGMTLRIAMQS
jgi:hypothetical protein